MTRCKVRSALAFVCFSAFVSAGCAGETSPPTPPAATRPVGFIRSVVPTPKAWTGDDVKQAFKTAAEAGPLVCLPDPVDWFHAEGKRAEQSKPYRDAQMYRVLAEQNHLDIWIQIDPYKNRRGPIPVPRGLRPTFGDRDVRAAYLADVESRVKLHKPKYVCLAMEINAYYEQIPRDFETYVTLFSEARRAVKRIVPDAVVFVSLQYEQLLGIFGGQAGLPKHAPHWELLERFADADAVGISSYPMKQMAPQPLYGDPADIPPDYYTRIAQHTGKPIIFAELGWPSGSKAGGSPEKQAAFLKRFPTLIEGLDVRMVNWNFLYDIKGFGEVFDTMGLLDEKGEPKPALAVWKSMPEPGGAR